MVNRPHFQKVLRSRPRKCGSCRAWPVWDPTLFCNLWKPGASLLHGWRLLHWKPLNEQQREAGGEDNKWKKSLTAGSHKGSSKSFRFSHAEYRQKRNYYAVPPQDALQWKAKEKLTLYKSGKCILLSLVLHEWSSEACFDFSTRNNFKSVRVWAQQTWKVTLLFSHVCFQACSITNPTQPKT